MEAAAKVAISADFLTAFAALPRQIQGKVTEFINKFRNNPQSPGINYEKINGGMDKNHLCLSVNTCISPRPRSAGAFHRGTGHNSPPHGEAPPG